MLRLRAGLFLRDFWFSEWESETQTSSTGEFQIDRNIKTDYWPAVVKRKKPEWIDDIGEADWTLWNLVQMYTALDNDLRVLAAIGVRTAFDRSSELLKVDPALSFDKKLDALVLIGKISKDEEIFLGFLLMRAMQRHTAPGYRSPNNSAQ